MNQSRRPTGAAILAAALLPLLLAACGTTRPEVEVRTVEVQVPVMVSCVPDGVETEPDYEVTLADLAAIPPGPALLAAVWAFALERHARVEETDPVVRGCAATGEPPAAATR